MIERSSNSIASSNRSARYGSTSTTVGACARVLAWLVAATAPSLMAPAVLAQTPPAAAAPTQPAPPTQPAAQPAAPANPPAQPAAPVQPGTAQPPVAQPPTLQPLPAGQPPAAPAPAAGQPPAADVPAPVEPPGTAAPAEGSTAAQPPAEPVAPAASAPAAAATATPAAPAEPATPAEAAKPEEKEPETAEERLERDLGERNSAAEKLSLGLAPGAPQYTALPGGTGASVAGAAPAGYWYFDFHGFVSLPLRVGLNQRENAGAGQKVLVLHTPPRVPGEFESFGYTSIDPDPWVQLNFAYGKQTVVATVIVAARAVSDANAYFNPPDHIGINDAFLTFRLPDFHGMALNLDVGAFSNRYGHMGERDMGRYGTPLIARVAGAGATGTAVIPVHKDVEVVAEAGVMTQLNKAPVGVEPAGWNGFADPNVGSTFAPHFHAAVGYAGVAQLGGHIIYASAQDDRAAPAPRTPDGSLSVLALDGRLTMGRFGHFYAGVANTSAETVRTVSSVVRILNAPGGPGLMREYFGADPTVDCTTENYLSCGSGSLLVAGAQYDLSLGNLLRYPMRFDGNGPDLFASLFGTYATVSVPEDAPNADIADGVKKLKYGGELTYTPLSWFAVGGRYDRVINDVHDATKTCAILSPRAIFRSDWTSTDQVMLQYSRQICGSGTVVVDGYPPHKDPSIEPDADVLSLTAAMWW